MEGKSIATKLFGLVLWTVVSLVVSYVIGSLDGSLMGQRSGHDAAVATCVVKASDIDVTLGDVAGLDVIKEEIYYSLLLPLRHPRTFFRKSGPFATTRGVLLTGPPGCGKTMLMKAVAKTCGCTFLCPTLASLQNKYYGESQKLLSAMFSLARRNAPCILFLDEVDSVFRTRSDDDSGCEYTLKTEFLSHMDGLRTRADEAVVVVGATNNPGALDPAFKRRLPTVLCIGLPTARERAKIIELACREEPAGSAKAFRDADGQETTRGCSGADLMEVYRLASRRRLRFLMMSGALEGPPPPLTQEHWEFAIRQLREGRLAASEAHCKQTSKFAELLSALRAPPEPDSAESSRPKHL